MTELSSGMHISVFDLLYVLGTEVIEQITPARFRACSVTWYGVSLTQPLLLESVATADEERTTRVSWINGLLTGVECLLGWIQKLKCNFQPAERPPAVYLDLAYAKNASTTGCFPSTLVIKNRVGLRHGTFSVPSAAST